jgi:hypothetical protein
MGREEMDAYPVAIQVEAKEACGRWRSGCRGYKVSPMGARAIEKWTSLFRVQDIAGTKPSCGSVDDVASFGGTHKKISELGVLNMDTGSNIVQRSLAIARLWSFKTSVRWAAAKRLCYECACL